MGFTFGFYDAYEHDRRYNAIQMSSIFDGLITDGVYSTVGKSLIVKAIDGEENVVIVQSGRAWFDHTWNLNDADLPILCAQSDIVLDRIDAIVLDINTNIDNRFNDIIFVKGTPSEKPARPKLIKSEKHNQYPLAYIYRKQNVEQITNRDITVMVGTSECPFVTGILQQLSIEELLLGWEGQWKQLFIDLKDMLGEDAALSLALRIMELQELTNSLKSDLTAQDGVGFKFRINEKGKYGYYGLKNGVMTFFPFSRGNFLEDTSLGGAYEGAGYNLGQISNGYSLAGKIPYYDKIRTSDFKIMYTNLKSRAECSSDVDDYGDNVEASGNPVTLSYNPSNGVISLTVYTRDTEFNQSSPGGGRSENCFSDKWTSNRARIASSIYVGTYNVYLMLPPDYDER